MKVRLLHFGNGVRMLHAQYVFRIHQDKSKARFLAGTNPAFVYYHRFDYEYKPGRVRSVQLRADVQENHLVLHSPDFKTKAIPLEELRKNPGLIINLRMTGTSSVLTGLEKVAYYGNLSGVKSGISQA